MTEELTAADFESLTDEDFKLSHDQLPEAGAKLLEVVTLGDQAGPSGRTPFSLLFACDSDAEPEQSVFDIEHAKLGRQTVFLVPVGKDDRGLLLEAVFT